MVTRIVNIRQQVLGSGKNTSKNEKECGCKLESLKAGEKARQLMRSIMSDLPEDNEVYTHNCD